MKGFTSGTLVLCDGSERNSCKEISKLTKEDYVYCWDGKSIIVDNPKIIRIPYNDRMKKVTIGENTFDCGDIQRIGCLLSDGSIGYEYINNILDKNIITYQYLENKKSKLLEKVTEVRNSIKNDVFVLETVTGNYFISKNGQFYLVECNVKNKRSL